MMKIRYYVLDHDDVNAVVDSTEVAQYWLEVNSAFQWTSKEWPVSEGNMFSLRLSLTDGTLHARAMRRRAD